MTTNIFTQTATQRKNSTTPLELEKKHKRTIKMHISP